MWADKLAIETLHPKFLFKIEESSTFKTGETRTAPVNSSKDPKRPWDIPIVAWENDSDPSDKFVVLIPTHWTELSVQFQPEETYRLKESFVQGTLPNLLTQGMILRNLFLGHPELNEYLKESFTVWVRLKEALLHQHKEMRRRYEDKSLREIDEAMQESLKEEAEAAFLAFSTVDFRPKYHL